MHDIRAYIRTYILTYTHTSLHACGHACTRCSICIYICTYVDLCVCSCIYIILDVQGPFQICSGWFRGFGVQGCRGLGFRVQGVGGLLGGSRDLVSKVISPLIGVISNYKYSYLIYNPSY